MTTTVIIVVAIFAAIAIVAIFAALTYKKQRDDGHTALGKAEQAKRDATDERDSARKDRDATQTEYDAFRKRAQEDQVVLVQRHDAIIRLHDDELNLYKEIIDAKLTALTAADLSDAASGLLQARRDRKARSSASTGPATVLTGKPA